MKFKLFIEENEIANLAASIKARYPLKYFNVYEKDHAIFLDMINIEPENRKQGIGAAIIRELQDYARSVNKPIVLSPEPEKGKKAALERFYKRLGFVHNRGRNKDYTLSQMFAPTMVWRPS